MRPACLDESDEVLRMYMYVKYMYAFWMGAMKSCAIDMSGADRHVMG